MDKRSILLVIPVRKICSWTKIQSHENRKRHPGLNLISCVLERPQLECRKKRRSIPSIDKANPDVVLRREVDDLLDDARQGVVHPDRVPEIGSQVEVEPRRGVLGVVVPVQKRGPDQVLGSLPSVHFVTVANPVREAPHCPRLHLKVRLVHGRHALALARADELRVGDVIDRRRWLRIARVFGQSAVQANEAWETVDEDLTLVN